MTVHERPVGETVDWYTPTEFFDRLGLTFDLDPAAGLNGEQTEARNRVPARMFWTALHDGLAHEWFGRVWLNPPYGRLLPSFVEKMCEHRHGLMLVPARTETDWWQRAAASADLVVFLRDRLHFVRGSDGYQARAAFGSCLFVWGIEECYAVTDANLGWWAPGDADRTGARLSEVAS